MPDLADATSQALRENDVIPISIIEGIIFSPPLSSTVDVHIGLNLPTSSDVKCL